MSDFEAIARIQLDTLETRWKKYKEEVHESTADAQTDTAELKEKVKTILTQTKPPATM